jgi:transposase
MAAKKRKNYSREFKVETVKLITEGGESVSQVALDMGIHENTLYKWVRTLSVKPEEAFPQEPLGRPKNRNLLSIKIGLNLHSWGVPLSSQIYQSMSKSESEYPLEAGIRDVIRYYNEGFVTSALASLAATTALEAKDAAAVADAEKLLIE